MDCPKCKNPLQDGWKVCPWCGTAAQKTKTQSRRQNGTGNVYKRGKTWTARITVGTTIRNGKVCQMRRTKGGFSTKTEALKYCAVLAEQKTELRAVPTLEYYYGAFLSGKGDKLSPSKQTAYRIAFNKLEQLASHPIDTISVTELQNLMRRTCPTYYPARDMRVLLTHLYKLAAVDGFANASLPSLLELPKLQEETREPFTQEDQAALWRLYEAGNANASIPLIMIYTGMMTGEMRKLTAEMVDLEKKEIVGVGLKTETRKKSSVLLPDAILPVLSDVLSRTPEGKLYPMNEMAFYDLYYDALEKAGTRRLTPYSCRHTAATALAVDENIAPQTVQRLMRWSSTKMMDRYVHPSEENAREAVNRRKRV